METEKTPGYGNDYGWEYPTAVKPRVEVAVATCHWYYQTELGITLCSRRIPTRTARQTEEVGGAQQSPTGRKMHSGEICIVRHKDGRRVASVGQTKLCEWE
jgi:hypothetical protein